MKKIVFISSIAAPIQVKFCYKLSKFYDCQFWFHEYLGKHRPIWWKIELGERCKILSNVIVKRSGFYLSLSIISQLEKFNPEIIILGGFKIISNFIAYKWGKKRKKRILVFSETFRKNGTLSKKNIFYWITQLLYIKVDGIICSNQEAAIQFKEIFPQFRQKIHVGQYPSDIDEYFNHPLRKPKSSYTYLFPNRLIRIYNPLMAIDIFNVILKKYPGSVLKMNSMGEMHNECKKKIDELHIGVSIKFLDDIKSWNDMHLIYKDCDILVFPATFSNGNFSIIEAMASGMGIVISSKILWNSGMVENGINGFVCEPEIKAFVNCIVEYIENPILFKKHCINNREITKKYTAEKTAEIFKQIIDEILKQEVT